MLKVVAMFAQVTVLGPAKNETPAYCFFVVSTFFGMDAELKTLNEANSNTKLEQRCWVY